MNFTKKELHKLSAHANLGIDAMNFIGKQDAMKISFVRDMGLTEEEADEIVRETLEEVREMYERKNMKARLKVESTFTILPPIRL